MLFVDDAYLTDDELIEGEASSTSGHRLRDGPRGTCSSGPTKPRRRAVARHQESSSEGTKMSSQRPVGSGLPSACQRCSVVVPYSRLLAARNRSAPG